MKENNLASSYTKPKYKTTIDCNNTDINNVLDQKFDKQSKNRVIVSDLTYVKVNHYWNYICILIDLFNREIIGYSIGKNKDANLVYRALCFAKINISDIELFHTDRGKEFDNQKIDKLLHTFRITKSLSRKATPYDNAVSEATFKIIKTEFVKCKIYHSTHQLKLEFSDYVNWYNNHRIHSSLGYLSPKDYDIQNTLKNFV